MTPNTESFTKHPDTGYSAAWVKILALSTFFQRYIDREACLSLEISLLPYRYTLKFLINQSRPKVIKLCTIQSQKYLHSTVIVSMKGSVGPKH